MQVFKKGLLAGKRHVLHFGKFFGELEYDQHQPERSKLRFVIESHSVTCEDKWLTSRQRKRVVSFALDKMLVADRFPEIKYSSTVIVTQAANHYDLQGNLTIRGTTRPVLIHLATKLGVASMEVDGKAVVRMKDYGMKPPPDLLGLSGTKGKMKLRFLIWAERVTAGVRAWG